MSGSSSGSPSPAVPAEGGGALAPGFRFHPTDEELVGYYLKRKVLGRPFRVDAISEIDLYKTEPWDLPGKSRIQSRDTEWYFFSALDRKYANRSRTNRATGAGYWKTTGKDRAISRAGRTIGMKKTLVFHAGRAPKGARTNWVMHEYRLHDAHLPAAAVPQDGFVVCRIFQKRGPGPQNGAQYGAPLPVEDEWDECELPAIKEECGAEGSLSIGFSNPLPDGIADDDDDDPDADQGVEDRKPALALLVRTPGHGGDPNDCQEQELSNVVDGGTEGHELQEGDHNLAAPGASYADAADQWRSHAVLKDGYLELDDFADSAGANSRENAAAHPGEIIHNYEDSRQEDLNDVKEYFALNDENDDLSEHFSETGGGRRFLELGDLAGSEPHGSSSGEPADDGLVYFDATSHYPHGDHGFSSGMNCFLDTAMGGENGPDLMDEIMAYFDATENLQPSDLGIGSGASSSNQPCLAPAVNMDHTEAHGASPRSPAEAGCSSASPSSTPDVGKQSGSQGVDSHGEPDLQSGNSWEKALSKHLFNMLDAISPPPAFGEGHPMKGSQAIQHHSAARPSSSIHITAGMIQIHGVIMPGNGKNWSVQKNIDISFVFSYSEGSNVMDSGRMLKTPGGFLLRNSFHLLFLSVLFLTATFKIGLHVYTR